MLDTQRWYTSLAAVLWGSLSLFHPSSLSSGLLHIFSFFFCLVFFFLRRRSRARSEREEWIFLRQLNVAVTFKMTLFARPVIFLWAFNARASRRFQFAKTVLKRLSFAALVKQLYSLPRLSHFRWNGRGVSGGQKRKRATQCTHSCSFRLISRPLLLLTSCAGMMYHARPPEFLAPSCNVFLNFKYI